MSFLNTENEEVLKNLLFILKAKIPLEFNLLVMDLKLLQTVQFFFYRGSRRSSLKRDFIANGICPRGPTPVMSISGCGQQMWPERGVSQGSDIQRMRGGTWGWTPVTASLPGLDLCSARGLTLYLPPRRRAMLWAQQDVAPVRVAAGDALGAQLPLWGSCSLSNMNQFALSGTITKSPYFQGGMAKRAELQQRWHGCISPA